ncbi:LysR family transcriptional regulator [Methylobacterium sp. NEAU 140]|uniref:LysR family transcriptional regulator n=1 Tax=Methylobacterium sp. NEAU 140 TaxID=3064945 RepID=UPI00273596C4|nr:LysR family transcriptional regulator [Methylobacterium sp. NEAU 140]MDP4026420.1 LysR family transcriptional regulator [Methylobacterium sp. NEAU 140]
MAEAVLDIDGVRAFVRVVDLGSFTRAAEALATSQAAISLRVKRLEDRLGIRLVDRTPRHVAPTPRGARFLPAARRLLDAHAQAVSDLTGAPPPRLDLGISDHVAGPDLPARLARLGFDGAGLVAEVTILPSRALRAAFGDGRFDAVLVRDEGEEPGGTVLATERLAWFAAPGFAWDRDDPAAGPLRLATLAGPCNVRAAAETTLDAAGLPWREVFVGGGVLAVGAAVGAGLAVAALAPSTAPAGLAEAGARLGLPDLPVTRVVLHARPLRGRAAEALRALAAAYRGPNAP